MHRMTRVRSRERAFGVLRGISVFALMSVPVLPAGGGPAPGASARSGNSASQAGGGSSGTANRTASSSPASPSQATDPAQTVAADLRALTGGHTRLAWVQVNDRAQKSRGVYDLVGLDSDDSRGVHVILSPISSCVKPMLTPDGNQVVFSNRLENRIYIVNWDGSHLRPFVSGFATDVWRDPATSLVWLYVRGGDGSTHAAIRRFRLDQPDAGEVVWNKTPVDQESAVWFQVSRDGKRAAASFPWPKCGVATLPNGEWQLVGNGCWTSIAPDNSYRTFHFDGSHKQIILCDGDGSHPRAIRLSSAPGIGDGMALYPRWTHDVRFMTMVGPTYTNDGPGREHNSELYLGKFNAQFTAMERWVRITYNSVPDAWGDAWIETAPPAGPGGPAPVEAAAVPTGAGSPAREGHS